MVRPASSGAENFRGVIIFVMKLTFHESPSQASENENKAGVAGYFRSNQYKCMKARDVVKRFGSSQRNRKIFALSSIWRAAQRLLPQSAVRRRRRGLYKFP